jgi:hypothetical protein
VLEVTLTVASIPPGGGIHGQETFMDPELAEVFSSSIRNK